MSENKNKTNVQSLETKFKSLSSKLSQIQRVQVEYFIILLFFRHYRYFQSIVSHQIELSKSLSFLFRHIPQSLPELPLSLLSLPDTDTNRNSTISRQLGLYTPKKGQIQFDNNHDSTENIKFRPQNPNPFAVTSETKTSHTQTDPETGPLIPQENLFPSRAPFSHLSSSIQNKNYNQTDFSPISGVIASQLELPHDSITISNTQDKPETFSPNPIPLNSGYFPTKSESIASSHTPESQIPSDQDIQRFPNQTESQNLHSKKHEFPVSLASQKGSRPTNENFNHPVQSSQDLYSSQENISNVSSQDHFHPDSDKSLLLSNSLGISTKFPNLHRTTSAFPALKHETSSTPLPQIQRAKTTIVRKMAVDLPGTPPHTSNQPIEIDITPKPKTRQKRPRSSFPLSNAKEEDHNVNAILFNGGDIYHDSPDSLVNNPDTESNTTHDDDNDGQPLKKNKPNSHISPTTTVAPLPVIQKTFSQITKTDVLKYASILKNSLNKSPSPTDGTPNEPAGKVIPDSEKNNLNQSKSPWINAAKHGDSWLDSPETNQLISQEPREKDPILEQGWLIPENNETSNRDPFSSGREIQKKWMLEMDLLDDPDPMKSQKNNDTKSENNPSVQERAKKIRKVIRKKADRELLRRFPCPECRSWYFHYLEEYGEKYALLMIKNCKHRQEHTPPDSANSIWSVDRTNFKFSESPKQNSLSLQDDHD